MKKATIFTALIFGLLLQAAAQQRIVERTFEVEGDERLELDLTFGESISVSAWNRDEISFRAVIEINGGRLNDALELAFDHGNGLRVASDYNKEKLKGGRLEDCPEHFSRYHWNNDDDGGHVVCSRIQYELRVPAGIDLDVESISGDIELVGLSGPVRAKSISGFVDLSWPAGKGADISIKTVSGEAFTDLEDLQFENRKSHIPIVGYRLNGRIGSGGPRLMLESVSGNVYLRSSANS